MNKPHFEQVSCIVETIPIRISGRSGNSDCEAANSDDGCTVSTKQLPHKNTVLYSKPRYKTPVLGNKMNKSFDFVFKPPENASFTTVSSFKQSFAANLSRNMIVTHEPILSHSIDSPASIEQ